MTNRRTAHRSRSRAHLALTAAIGAGALAAPTFASAADPSARAFSLSGNGTSLLSYELTNPAGATTKAITGVSAGDVLVGVAVRPQTADLFAVGINDASDTATVYHLGAATGVATPVGTPVSWVDGAAATVNLTDAAYGVAFNPTVDRIRVVNSAGLNLRLNPNTGAAVDGDLGGAGGSAPGVNPDGAIKGAATSVDTTAYVNRRQSVTVTTQYTLSKDTDALYIQNPPNTGTQTAAVPLTLGGAPFNASAISGLDFKPDVSTAAANAPATGKAYATVASGGSTELATVDLTTGAVSVIGKVADGSPVRGLAIQGEEVAGGIPAVALAGFTLKRFNTATPGTVATANITGAQAGETIVAITRRPQTGQIAGLGVNPAANTGSYYVIDPQTAVATPVGPGSTVAFVESDGVTPVDLPDPDTTAYGVDFNPTVDRVRVVTGSGLNFRVNPNTGASVDANTMAAGVQTDGAINGLPGGSTGLSGTSYTNAFAQSLTGGVTTQYGLDATSNSLFIQTPPNNGTQTSQKAITLSGAALDFNDVSGFDIPSNVTVPTSNTPASGRAFAAFTVAAVSSLYTVDLATGAATNLGAVGGNASLESLVIGDPTPPETPVVPPTTPPTTTPPTTPPAVDPAPTLTGLSVSPKTFRTGKRPKGASKKTKTGTTISLTLSEASTVTFTVERKETGRRTGGSCKKLTSGNRKKKKCTRYVVSGTFTAAGTAGKNAIKFSGKIGKKTLPKASYRLSAVATDSAKQKSAPSQASFKIVR